MAKTQKTAIKTIKSQPNRVKPSDSRVQSKKTIIKTAKESTPSVAQNSIPSTLVSKTKKRTIKITSPPTATLKAQKKTKTPSVYNAEKITVFTQYFFAKYGGMMSKLSYE